MEEFRNLVAADESLNRVKRLVMYMLENQRKIEQNIQKNQYRLEQDIQNVKAQQERLSHQLREIQRHTVHDDMPLAVVVKEAASSQAQQHKDLNSVEQHQESTMSKSDHKQAATAKQVLTKSQKQSLERAQRVEKLDKIHQKARRSAQKLTK